MTQPNHTFKSLLAVASSAALLILAYQPAFGALSLFALAPVLWVATRSTPARAAASCAMALLLWSFYAYRLLPEMLLIKAADSVAMAWLAALLFCLWQALPYGLLGYCIARFNLLEQVAGTLLASAAFTLLIHYYPSPLALSPTIYFEIPLPLLQGLDITGITGLDFSLLTINLLLARAFINTGSKQQSIAIATACLALLWCYGQWRISSLEQAEQEVTHYPVAMVQTHFDSNISKNQSTQQLTDMTLPLLANQLPTLVVWPELPAPPRSRGDLRFRQAIEKLYSNNRQFSLITPIATAMPERHPVTGRNYQRNSLAVYNNGKLQADHHKTRLLPFVEYLPLEQQLPQIRSIFPKTAHYLSGDVGNSITLNNGLNLIPLICYESSAPEIARQAVHSADNHNGQLLVNIVNDIWTLNQQNALKHLRLASLRSVETRLPMVRVTNQGSSAYIASTGKIDRSAQLPDKSSASKVVSVPQVTHQSIYVQYGDWFVWLLWGMVAVCLLSRRIIARQLYTKIDTVILSK